MVKVLMVCMGNICRSPMAEAILRDLAKQAGVSDKLVVESAGTHALVGHKAHHGTLEVLKRHNIPHDGRARQLTAADFSAYDYILTMDRENFTVAQRQAHGGTAEVSMFMRYANDLGMSSVSDVPDPYYDGQFDRAYMLIHTGCAAFFDYLLLSGKL